MLLRERDSSDRIANTADGRLPGQLVSKLLVGMMFRQRRGGLAELLLLRLEILSRERMVLEMLEHGLVLVLVLLVLLPVLVLLLLLLVLLVLLLLVVLL